MCSGAEPHIVPMLAMIVTSPAFLVVIMMPATYGAKETMVESEELHVTLPGLAPTTKTGTW